MRTAGRSGLPAQTRDGNTPGADPASARPCGRRGATDPIHSEPRPPRALIRVVPGIAAWVVLGALATIVATMRAQLAILARYPAADWPALAGGLLVGGLVLFVAAVGAVRLRSPRRALWMLVGLPTLLGFAGGLSMIHFPRANFRSDELRAEWDRLHPTLRLALWIARLGDGDLVLTDVSREPSEYGATGLPRLRSSSHFLSPRDGYAHAVDLRVRDAGDLRNWARQGVFLILGLRAVRHDGTADHLHVSLPPRG